MLVLMELVVFVDVVVIGFDEEFVFVCFVLFLVVLLEEFVDVVGVVGNFECMVCIVDGIGILFDDYVWDVIEEMCEDFGLNLFVLVVYIFGF